MNREWLEYKDCAMQNAVNLNRIVRNNWHKKRMEQLKNLEEMYEKKMLRSMFRGDEVDKADRERWKEINEELDDITFYNRLTNEAQLEVIDKYSDD